MVHTNSRSAFAEISFIACIFLTIRKCKEATIGAKMLCAVPATPSTVTSTSEDPAWTPSHWRNIENSESSDENESHPDAVLDAYNDSIAKIVSLSDARVESLKSRLHSNWESVSENEKAIWEKHFDEACRAVC